MQKGAYERCNDILSINNNDDSRAYCISPSKFKLPAQSGIFYVVGFYEC